MLFKKVRSIKFAAQGFRIAFREEHNFRFQIGIGIATVLLGWYVGLSAIEWFFVISAIGLVLSAELFNTALEELCDMLRQTHDPHVAKIKDVSAAAVSVAALTALVLGVGVFIPHFL
jgi:diacylglycerol kinase